MASNPSGHQSQWMALLKVTYPREASLRKKNEFNNIMMMIIKERRTTLYLPFRFGLKIDEDFVGLVWPHDKCVQVR